MDFKRIGSDGKSYFYYSLGQKFVWTTSDGSHVLEIEECTLSESGIQYYLYSIDGRPKQKLESAARVHFVLNEKKATCISNGQSILLKNSNEPPKTYSAILSEDEKQLIEQYRRLNTACKKLIKDNINMFITTTASKQKRKNNAD